MPKTARSRNGVVVAAHPLAAEAGRRVLAEGGTAADAGIAVSLALGVVEPFASGLGGGGFLLWVPEGGGARTVALDFRGSTPSIQSEEHFYPRAATLPWVPKIGPSSATLPGLGRAIEWLLGRARFALPRLAEPAARLAEEGFETSEVYEYVSGLFEGTLRCFPDAAAIYFREGRRFRPGERLRQPDLAKAIRRVAAAGPADLYEGEIGRAMIRAVNATGPVWGDPDLAAYRAKERPPLRARIGTADVATMGPPSRGGAGMLAALRRFAEAGIPGRPHNGRDAIVAMGAIFRDLFGKLDEVIGDPDVFPVDLGLLDQAAAGAAPAGDAGTSHFTIVDKAGNLLCMSQTIGHFFGSGVIVPGWGILLNDDISDMERRPGGRNSVGPSRRAVSNMAPTAIFEGDRPRVALGSPGSLRIFPCLSQVVANLLQRGMGLEEAVQAGRIHWEDGTLWLEGDIDPAERAAARSLWKGRVVERRPRDLFFGGVHAVERLPDGAWRGVADPRRDGVALGV